MHDFGKNVHVDISATSFNEARAIAACLNGFKADADGVIIRISTNVYQVDGEATKMIGSMYDYDIIKRSHPNVLRVFPATGGF